MSNNYYGRSVNPEMNRRSEWDNMSPNERQRLMSAMRAELLRLYDCVEDWMPITERKTSTQFEVLVDVGRQLRYGDTYQAPVPDLVVKSSQSKLMELSIEQD